MFTSIDNWLIKNERYYRWVDLLPENDNVCESSFSCSTSFLDDIFSGLLTLY